MKIKLTLMPENQDIDTLTRGINAEAQAHGMQEAYSFAFFLHNEHEDLLGGCNGSVVFGEIYTDQLWIHPDYQRQGWGRQLMESVHQYGREVGCTMATVCTMSFQNARPFYEALGYVCDFERSGYANNAKCFSLVKIL